MYLSISASHLFEYTTKRGNQILITTIIMCLHIMRLFPCSNRCAEITKHYYYPFL